MNSRMRHLLAGMLAVFSVLFIAGCILPPPDSLLRFLSADPGFGNRFLGGIDTLTDAPGAPEDDGGGGDREVVEPDVIRQSGELLFVLNQYRGLSIVDLESEALLSQTPTYGFPRDLYLVGNRAYILVGYAGDIIAENDSISFNVGSRLYVLDVSDVHAPTVLSTFDLAGDFVDSRLVGDVLYAVSAEYTWHFDGVEVAKQQNTSSWVSSINVADPNNITLVDTLDFGGYGNVIQTTNYAIFVAAQNWQDNASPITYIDISDPNGAIAVRGAIKVPGFVGDKFKMDAYQGVLRVVSNTGWPDRVTYITTIDLADPDKLAQLGQSTIDGTENESLFATRFDGPRGYVVTYFQVDPLFVLDLSDPTNPVVSGVLEVPGWSTHIEPQGDRLIALGVDDTNGRKVSVSIFDVTDTAAPALLDRESFGEDWSWSTAFSDVKAFTVLDDTLIIPFTGWNYGAGGYDRLQFVSYTQDELTLQGFVDLEGQILRSFRYGEHYYGVTTEEVAVIGGDSLNDLEVENRIVLAENVNDIVELDNGTLLSNIAKYNQNKSVFRANDANGNALSSVELKDAWFDSLQVWGNTLVLMRQRWEDYSYTEVVLINYDDPANPVVGEPINVDITPAYWWGPWYYDFGGPVPLAENVEPGGVAGGAASKSVVDLWYPYTPGESNFVVGDHFVIHGWTSALGQNESFEEPQSALAVIDLNTREVTGIVGLDLANVQKLDAVDNLLYLSYKEEISTDILGRIYSAFFISSFDPTTLTLGEGVNVPGTYLQYDPATKVLVLEDYQYTLDFNIKRSVRSVVWDGGTEVELVDQLALDEKVGQLYAHGTRVYFDYYDGAGYELGSIGVKENGDLGYGTRQQVHGPWAWFLDADEDTAYVNVGSRALARYDFSGPEATVRDITPVMQTPYKLRIGESMVYLPSGYSGVLKMPR